MLGARATRSSLQAGVGSASRAAQLHVAGPSCIRGAARSIGGHAAPAFCPTTGPSSCWAWSTQQGLPRRSSPRTAAVEASSTAGSPSLAEAVKAEGPVRNRLSGPSLEAWQNAEAALMGAVEGMSQDDACKLLEKAFGWGSQAFWRGSKVEEVPPEMQVEDALAYLASLGIEGADLAKVLKAFPEAVACSVEGQLEVAVAKLQGDWKLQGDVLMRALVRRPQVLGYSLDCEGTCFGECNRCWARF